MMNSKNYDYPFYPVLNEQRLAFPASPHTRYLQSNQPLAPFYDPVLVNGSAHPLEVFLPSDICFSSRKEAKAILKKDHSTPKFIPPQKALSVRFKEPVHISDYGVPTYAFNNYVEYEEVLKLLKVSDIIIISRSYSMYLNASGSLLPEIAKTYLYNVVNVYENPYSNKVLGICGVVPAFVFEPFLLYRLICDTSLNPTGILPSLYYIRLIIETELIKRYSKSPYSAENEYECFVRQQNEIAMPRLIEFYNSGFSQKFPANCTTFISSPLPFLNNQIDEKKIDL